jgi:DNA modification methylase
MKPIIELGGARVFHGDCRDVLRGLPDNSVDSVVTDPPYELGFMGKKWDSSGIAYDVTVWAECLRVLKPGGHILAFGGSRTWHRLAVAVEDAGFELRDSIAWIYGSGFPKSLDVSKAIDKGQGANKERQLQFVRWMRETGLKASEINDIIGKSDVGSHYLRFDQPAIATADLFDKLRPYLPEVPEAIERLVAERTGIEWTAYKQREVIGQKMSGIADKNEKGRHTIGASKAVEVDITAPATPEAQKWQGWGTALKPAFEPVVVGRKPLVGTVAENVLAWGVGGLNIDGSRIGSENRNISGMKSLGVMHDDNWEPKDIETKAVQGRWPANVILDEVSAGLLDEQTGDETSRFFYQAKASKRDRNEGLEELPKLNRYKKGGVGGTGGKRNVAVAENATPVSNFHPTVKPTQLMRYLIKLVTPPGGVVLDPFTGSGSTGKAALLDGFDFVGIELTDDYLPIIEGRLRWAVENREDGDVTLF